MFLRRPRYVDETVRVALSPLVDVDMDDGKAVRWFSRPSDD